MAQEAYSEIRELARMKAFSFGGSTRYCHAELDSVSNVRPRTSIAWTVVG